MESYNVQPFVSGFYSMLLRPIQVVVRISTTFLFMAEWYSVVYVDHILFIHLSVDGHLDGFHLLAIVNSAVMNIHV